MACFPGSVISPSVLGSSRNLSMVFLQMCISRTPKAVRGDESLEGLGLEKHSLGHGGDAEGKGGEHDGLHF